MSAPNCLISWFRDAIRPDFDDLLSLEDYLLNCRIEFSIRRRLLKVFWPQIGFWVAGASTLCCMVSECEWRGRSFS